MSLRAPVMVAAIAAGLVWNAVAVTAQTASMTVSATVRPSCRVTVEPAAADESGSTRVALACGHPALRTLRVSTDSRQPLVRAAMIDRDAQAWREMHFIMPHAVAVLASGTPRALPAEPPRREVVTVTFDF